MEKRVTVTLLSDFYGALLTPHTREVLRLYLEEDMSLQEIASELGVSRQAVHDAVARGEKQLAEYEEKLGLLERFRRMQERLTACREALETAAEALETAKAALKDIEEP